MNQDNITALEDHMDWWLDEFLDGQLDSTQYELLLQETQLMEELYLDLSPYLPSSDVSDMSRQL